MKICYNDLLKILVDKKKSKIEFARALGIFSNTIAKISKNQPISMKTLLKICDYLKCESFDEIVSLDNVD